MSIGLAQYKVIFLVQLLVGEGMFLFRLERRPSFALRAVAAVTAVLAAAAVFPIPVQNAGYVSFLFLSLFACTLLAASACFDEPAGNILFCGIAGYTVQHLAYLFFAMLTEVTRMDLLFGGVFDLYSSAHKDLPGLPAIMVVFYMDCYFLVYTGAFMLFDKVLKGNHDLYLGRTSMVCLSGLLIVADVIFNMITNYYTTQWVSLLLERSYNILICVLILVLFHSQLTRRELSAELEGVNRVLEQGRKQYIQAQKSVDLVNMKYHDLRHQSELLRRSGGLALEEKAELDQVLEGYAVQFRTGSEVLDTILTEKTLLCQGQGVELQCIADGRNLDFIKAHHLYALLGNAIDNAIDAVLHLPETERTISLYVRRAGELVNIHMENRYVGSLTLRDGLPVTSKEDHDYHGFGMLSMRTIAERYGGTLAVRTEDGIFSLDILLNGRETGEK